MAKPGQERGVPRVSSRWTERSPGPKWAGARCALLVGSEDLDDPADEDAVLEHPDGVPALEVLVVDGALAEALLDVQPGAAVDRDLPVEPGAERGLGDRLRVAMEVDVDAVGADRGGRAAQDVRGHR